MRVVATEGFFTCRQGALVEWLRFGWSYAADAQAERGRQQSKLIPDWLKDQNWVRTAYAQGVPMGGDLPPLPKIKKAPSRFGP